MFCFDLLVFGLNRNVLLCLRQFSDQIKLLCFVPEFLGQNENDLLAIQCFMYQISLFAFVPIISFDIETFVLSFNIVDITILHANVCAFRIFLIKTTSFGTPQPYCLVFIFFTDFFPFGTLTEKSTEILWSGDISTLQMKVR